MTPSKNNISNNNYNKELSIQINLSGLSFCILQKETNTVEILKHFNFDKKLNPFEILDRLKHLFNTEEVLKQDFEKVNIIHDNELSTLVPKPLFNEEALADYLKFNSKILKSDFIAYEEISLNESVNVYVPYVNINNFIYDKFGIFIFKHISTILIEQILLIEKHSDTQKVYVNVSKNHFEILSIDKGKLKLYNTHKYNTKEDFIYHLLFTVEQLNLNPETLNLVFLGDINTQDDIYTITYKYIRFVKLHNIESKYKYNANMENNNSHSNFALIKSFQ